MPTLEKCIVYKEFCFVWASISSSSNSTTSPSKNKVEGEVVGLDPLGACVNYQFKNYLLCVDMNQWKMSE